MTMTITEALAELKTIEKRIEKKKETINTFLSRQEALKDPLTKEGGSANFVQRERQAMSDLEARKVSIRLAVAKANMQTPITVNGNTKSIAEWLVWRRDVAPQRQTHLTQLRQRIDAVRQQASRLGATVVPSGTNTTEPPKPNDIIVNIDEGQLSKDIETLEETLGVLDGQLSLKNATVVVEV